eukprot:gnl/TRDRNA2_/TRDRNA2_193050_c0_seq1.p1 gnl/TRDRNA2_/TRDRNA2_193050_c0~~gnl/TRDRNA2_/TRDRNA2_193050_c0_seq1.p1  ORF type:complete len:413 (+),score=49.78 gnl/TRDRNA2_/TRDRNA2_193050_c0_seq1:79-1317(+)
MAQTSSAWMLVLVCHGHAVSVNTRNAFSTISSSGHIALEQEKARKPLVRREHKAKGNSGYMPVPEVEAKEKEVPTPEVLDGHNGTHMAFSEVEAKVKEVPTPDEMQAQPSIALVEFAAAKNPTGAAPTWLDSSAVATKVASVISNSYAFTEGTSGNQITDGGNDMYDGGNILNIKRQGTYQNRLAYTNQCPPSGTPTTTNSLQYYTCKVTSPMTLFIAEFYSASVDIQGFKTTGNLGADGGGRTASGKLQANGWHGYWRTVGHAHDPSINQLVILQQDSWTNTCGSSTDDGTQEVTASNSPVDRVIYLMWAGQNGQVSTEAQITTVMTSVTDDLMLDKYDRTFRAIGCTAKLDQANKNYLAQQTMQVWLYNLARICELASTSAHHAVVCCGTGSTTSTCRPRCTTQDATLSR